MAPIMALNPVIRANAKTEPDQTCFCVVVGEKSENQSVSRIVTIAHLTREREREKRKTTRREVLMLTMKKDKSLRVKNTTQQKPFPRVCIITKERIPISNWNQRTHQHSRRLVSYRQTTVIHGQNSRDKERLIANFRG
jgi:hypothetical protein